MQKLNKAMSDTLDDPAVRKRLEDLGLEIVAPERRTPEYLAKFLPEEVARWSKVVQAAGIIAGYSAIGEKSVRCRRSGGVRVR